MTSILRRVNSELLSRSAISFAIQGFGAVASTVTTILLARFLGAEKFGIYALVFSFVTLFSIPAKFGLPTLVIREVAAARANQSWSYLKAIIRWSRVIATLLLSLCISVGFAGILYYKKSLTELEYLTAVAGLILLPLLAILSLQGATLKGLGKTLLGQLPELLLRPTLFAIFLLMSVLFWPSNLTPHLAMIIHCVAAFIALIVSSILVAVYQRPYLDQIKASNYDTKRWLKGLAILGLLSSSHLLYGQTDIILLGLLRSPEEVGIYRVAVQVVTILTLISNAVQTLIAPNISMYFKQDKLDKLQVLVSQAARYCFIAMAAVVLLLVILGDGWLGLLFGNEFVQAYVPLLILGLGQVVVIALGFQTTVAAMIEQERNALGIVLIGAGLNIALNLIFIPLFGLKGAAMATFLSLVSARLLLAYRVKRITGINTTIFVLKNNRSN